MGSLFEWITDWIKEGLIDAITGQYTSIFNSVNNQVADVANQVGQTPQGWNGGVFSMIQNLSETVVIPIAGMILTFVLVYELIQMILEKNNIPGRQIPSQTDEKDSYGNAESGIQFSDTLSGLYGYYYGAAYAKCQCIRCSYSFPAAC